MSQINISEIDSTSPGVLASSTYVVLLPGTCKKALDGEEFTFVSVDGQITYHDNTTSFKELFEGENNNTNYKIAYHLLELGLPVHYVVVEGSVTESGDDPNDDPAIIAKLEQPDFWTKFEDKSIYDLRFITAGSFTSKTIAENILSCAAHRGDAVGLVDAPKTTEYSTKYVSDWANEITAEMVRRADGVLENSLAYGACFAPSITFNSPYFKNDTTEYPASFAYLVCFAAHNVSDFPEWFATAGSVRGVLPYDGVEPMFRFGDADNALLQDRTTADKRAVNPIQLVRPYGNIVWGARTLFPNKVRDDGTAGLVASSFLNIRQLCCTLKKQVYRASRRYTYDPNSDTLWINYTSLIKPILENMKTNQGIKGYKFIKQTAEEKATLKAKIKIIPIEPVEDFYITVHMVDSIVEVSE